MTKDEALKMAIDYLGGSYEAHKVRKACQEALEQPSVAELNDQYLHDTYVEGLSQPAQEPVEVGTNGTAPLPKIRYESYQWQGNKEFVGLSDDEIHNYADHNFAFASEHFDEIFKFARAVEQALKEKNNG